MPRWRSIWLVARREILERGRSRGFILSIAFTTLIVVGSFVIPALVFGGDNPTKVGVVDPAPPGLQAAIEQSAQRFDKKVTVTTFPDSRAADAALQDGSTEIVIEIPADLSGPGEIRVKRQPDQATAQVIAAATVALRVQAILGQSDQCIATHPSDMCVALATLDAVVHVQGPGGERAIPIGDFHRLPGTTPNVDTNLQPNELITSVDLPNIPFATRSHYLKVRDRATYAFALVSVAAILELEDGMIKSARVALGGVAHKPWRATKAEQMLTGKTAEVSAFAAAASAELASAKSYRYNTFKIELAKRAIVQALTTVAAMT